MELKKSAQADLERHRLQRLLLGVVVALACTFVALEYTVEPDDPLADPELLERLDNEMELPPLLNDNNEMMLAPKAEPKPETKLVVVEEEEVEMMNDDEQVETDVDDDVEAQEEVTELEPPPPPPDEETVDLRIVEDVPQFPGGATEFIKWLTRNLKYPVSLKELQIQGKVVAEFIVNTDGSVSDLELVEHLDAACDREVLRVLRMMPKWTPGVMDAKPCRTKVCIPVVFKL